MSHIVDTTASGDNIIRAQDKTGLVGQWTLASADYNDPVVQGQYGSDDITAVHSPTLTTGHDGRANTALAFDGSNDYLKQKVYYNQSNDDGEVTGVLTNGSATVVINDTSDLGTTYDGASGDNKYMIVMTDNAGKVAWGYLGTNSFSTPSNTYEIYSTKTGTTQNYADVSTFDFATTPITYEIRKSDFQITGALTVGVWVKHDDGQPAAAQYILSKYSTNNNQRSFALNMRDSGKVRLHVSADGLFVDNYEETNNAIFTNGAQTDFKHIIVVYDTSTAKIYVDGVLQASTTGAGGIPTSLYDAYEPLAVSANEIFKTPTNFFNGSIQNPFIYNRALSATEVANLYNSQKHQFIA